MSENPAVVIPAYNAERLLEPTVRSVLAQTFVEFRLVIVNDGSKDGTQALAERLAREDPRIEVVARPNGGLSAARNTGFDALPETVDAVLFLDADDVLEPDALDKLTKALAAAPPAAVGVYGLPRDMSYEGELVEVPLHEAWGYRRHAIEGLNRRELLDSEPSGFSVFVIWPAIETAGQALIRSSALRRVGPWRTMPGEDWEMWLRLTAQGEFAFLPEFTLRKRATPGSLSSDGKWLARAEPIIRGALTSDAFTPEQRRVARAGELYSVLFKLSWAGSALRERRPVHAARQALRAIKSFGSFVGRVGKY